MKPQDMTDELLGEEIADAFEQARGARRDPAWSSGRGVVLDPDALASRAWPYGGSLPLAGSISAGSVTAMSTSGMAYVPPRVVRA